jgi:8-oxo-dGTP pyrophosphatase MutT (NUDIX family)
MNEFAELLTRIEAIEDEPHSGRTARPRDAATLVLVDRSASEPRVLLGRRHGRHTFMPDRFVFPGGRVDAEDARMPVAAALDAADERRLMQRMQRPTRSRARALALTAIRETLEETGLILGRKSAEAFAAPAPTWQPFAEAGVRPDLSALTFVFRAITPPKRPRRFDTRFFLADRSAVVGEIGGVVGPDAEFIELKWLTFAEAEHENLPTVTKVVLAETAARLAASASASAPVPFYYWKAGRFHREELN